MRNFLCICLFLFAANTSFSQWVHVNPGTTNWIVDVCFATDQIGYATDDHTGKVWKTTDGGATWTWLNNNLFVTKMTFISPDTGLALTDSGLAKTVDGGYSWQSVLWPPTTSWWTHPVFFNNLTGITAQESGTNDSIHVYKTNDGGDTWYLVAGVPASMGAYVPDVSFPDSMNGYILGETNMYKTSDGGMSWSLIQTHPYGFGSISFISPDTGFAFANMGAFYRTYNGGLSWDSFPVPVTPYNGQVRFLNSSIGYMCGGDGLTSGFVMKTVDGGQNWTLDHGDNFTFLAFSFPGNNMGYACGGGGSVIKKTIVDVINIDPENSSGLIQVSNNPFYESFSLNSSNTSLKGIRVEMFNPSGQIVFEKDSVRLNEDINFKGLKPGIYFLEVTAQELAQVIKIVKAD